MSTSGSAPLSPRNVPESAQGRASTELASGEAARVAQDILAQQPGTQASLHIEARRVSALQPEDQQVTAQAQLRPSERALLEELSGIEPQDPLALEKIHKALQKAKTQSILTSNNIERIIKASPFFDKIRALPGLDIARFSEAIMAWGSDKNVSSIVPLMRAIPAWLALDPIRERDLLWLQQELLKHQHYQGVEPGSTIDMVRQSLESKIQETLELQPITLPILLLSCLSNRSHPAAEALVLSRLNPTASSSQEVAAPSHLPAAEKTDAEKLNVATFSQRIQDISSDRPNLNPGTISRTLSSIQQVVTSSFGTRRKEIIEKLAPLIRASPFYQKNHDLPGVEAQKLAEAIAAWRADHPTNLDAISAALPIWLHVTPPELARKLAASGYSRNVDLTAHPIVMADAILTLLGRDDSAGEGPENSSWTNSTADSFRAAREATLLKLHFDQV